MMRRKAHRWATPRLRRGRPRAEHGSSLPRTPQYYGLIHGRGPQERLGWRSWLPRTPSAARRCALRHHKAPRHSRANNAWPNGRQPISEGVGPPTKSRFGRRCAQRRHLAQAARVKMHPFIAKRPVGARHDETARPPATATKYFFNHSKQHRTMHRPLPQSRTCQAGTRRLTSSWSGHGAKSTLSSGSH